MATEIERKFLVSSDAWRASVHEALRIRQGYLSTETNRTVRVRTWGDSGFLTIKGRRSGISRAEFEYEVPLDDARQMLELCPVVLDKTRHLVNLGGHTWEIDEFHGDNDGLIVAELELSSEDEAFERPEWIDAEVSEDSRYTNSALTLRPYSSW